MALYDIPGMVAAVGNAIAAPFKWLANAWRQMRVEKKEGEEERDKIDEAVEGKDVKTLRDIYRKSHR